MFRFLEGLTEIIGWIKIFLSLVFSFGLVGGLLYLFIDGLVGLILGAIILVAGIVMGIIIATRKWKNEGTMNFLSSANIDPKEIIRKQKNQ